VSLEDFGTKIGAPDWLANKRRALLVLCAALLVLVGVALLVGKLAGYHRIINAVEEADWRWLPLCLAGEVAAYVGYVLAFRDSTLADGGPILRRVLLLRVVFASIGATRLAAAGGAGGLAVDYWALRRARVPRHDAIRRVLAFNTLLYLFFGTLAWCAALLLLLHAWGTAPLGMTLPWLAVIPTCVLAAAWVSRPQRAARLTKLTGRWFRKAFADAVAGVVLVRHIVTRPHTYREGLIGAPLYWVGDMICLAAALRAFGVKVSLAGVVLAYCTGYLAVLLPLPTGAEGGFEASLTFTLHALGAPLAPALLAVLTYRFFSFWLPTLPAIAILPTLPHIARDLEAESPLPPETAPGAASEPAPAPTADAHVAKRPS
jgi:uncharacterized membrane protein YbhN (UPF0104 family)